MSAYPWELDPPQVGDPCWCIHHNPRLGKAPLEILTEPVANRVAYIRADKAAREVEPRLRALRKVKGKLPDALLTAYAEWQRADAERERACAERQRAYAEWQRADAEWRRAYAEWQRADAERERAYAEWQRADAERERACAERQRAYAAHEPELFALFRAECPDVAWGPDGLVFDGTNGGQR